METLWTFVLLMFVLAAMFGTLLYGVNAYEERKEACRAATCPAPWVVQFESGLCVCVMKEL